MIICAPLFLRDETMRLLGSRTNFVICTTARRASLTAAAVGNTWASSGSRRTRLVPARYCLMYLPRTPPFIDAKSYSGRMSFAGLRLAFFIKSSFVNCCSSGADNPNRFAILSVGHHEETSPTGSANGQEARLLAGMVRVGKC